MNRPCFQASTWYHAISLTERRASLRPLQGLMSRMEVNADLAERRMGRWRSQPPFTTSSYLAQRLAVDGMSEEEFLYLLGEPIAAIHKRSSVPPRWLAELDEAFSRPASPEAFSLPEGLRGHELAGFLEAIEPLVSVGRDRLHQGVQALSQPRRDLPFDAGTIEGILWENLAWRLIAMLGRTIVLELNVARLQGFLEGDTPEERFQSFVHRVRQRDMAISLLQEYPVLARQLTVCIDNWATFWLEFLNHLCADWEAIRTTFSPESEPGVLVHVDGGAGDSHRNGRSVLIAKFHSGLQVVYKPRSMALDIHFQELLTWLNKHGDHPPFPTLQILDRGTYGWTQFVEAKSCTTPAEVRRFYERQGGYLALLYALEATDFHFENLIAAGEHPVLLDLEALFHPRVEGVDIKQADQLAYSTLNYSVLRVGLLPRRIWANANSDGIDVSGLGAAAGQLSPYDVPHWEGAGTDEMRLIRKRAAMPERQNRPTLNGCEIDVLDYAEAIVTGFTAVYRLLLEHRDELLADDGPLARFAEDEVRVILRPTQTYGALLRESFHPDVLRDALDRDCLFDRLWAPVEHLPYLRRVIAAERADLQEGDIPVFTTHPRSRDLWSSSHERIADFFDEAGMALVQRRLEQLSNDDLAQQLWFIRASLATLSMEGERERWSSYGPIEPQSAADPEQLLAGARAVGDRLALLALRGEHDVSWVGLSLTSERRWSVVPLATDLYDGLPGVALFLAHLGAITREERYTSLAQAALTTMRRQVQRSRSSIKAIGGFNGWGGIIYTLTHLSVLWDELVLAREAEAMVELLPPLIEQDTYLDIIGGAAGCIASLISLYRCAPSDRTLAAAIQCGDRLLARAQSMPRGIGWVTPLAGPTALAGFSHGAAGIAWSLLELASLTGEDRFRTAALAAIDYERSLFCADEGNWPDLRERQSSRRTANGGQNVFVTAWCHGAPGIGLARLRTPLHVDDPAIRAEIRAALETTLARGFGLNHSLCHGDLGNLELLLQASTTPGGARWRAELGRIAAVVLASIRRDGWLCGVPLGVETPGLMTGLAGVGYGLLRLAEPTRVPSVLLLAPPTLDSWQHRRGGVSSS